MSWSQPSISGYNSSPPPDDGSTGSNNAITWAGIKAKLADPIKTLAESIVSSIAAYTTPTGVVLAFAGSSAPTGYLLCYGQAVSRSTYADLFSVVGTTYGSGDGSTTFNLPDFRGRAPFGKDDMGGSAANRITSGASGITGTSLGGTGGDERMYQHVHGHAHTHTMGNHTHGVPDFPTFTLVGVNSSGPTQNVLGGTTTKTSNGPSTNTTDAASTANTDQSGGGTSQNMPPAIIQNFIIKT